jgi:glycosyltransferase involved in cell wall biosynthesis
MAEIELSIIIPTHKRSRQLRACIESLLEQEGLPERLELIVVVDGADPETEGTLGSLELPFPLRVVVQDHARQAAARNRGAEEARGRYVLFLDDDVIAECQLVSAHLDALRAGDHIIGIGRIDKVLSQRAPRWSRSYQTVWRDHYDPLAAGREPRFSDTYGGNLSLPRRDFLAAGGFALELTPEEDVEFGYRLWHAGMTFVYVADAVAREGDRDALERFVADSRRRGVVSETLYERYPGLLPHLRLGGAGELPRGWIAFRRFALAFRFPPRFLALGAKLAPTETFAGRWLSFLYSYCYSRGVRDTVGDCASCSATITWFRSCPSRPSSASGVATTVFPAESAPRTFTRMPPPERTGAATTAAASFASALVELLEDRDRRVSVARAARVWAEANLDLDRCVREYEHLYEEVVR